MKKCFISFIIIAVIFGLTSIFSSYHHNEISQEKIELLYKVEDQDLAYQIAYDNDLTFVAISNYGFATYETSNLAQVNLLIEKGFVINNTSEIVAPPWQQPEDPMIGDQYALDLMDVYTAWTLTEGSADIIIAIIDTGIDTDHEEFIGRLSASSYNSRTKQVGLAHVEDDNGHGTSVAGVIGANKDNSIGIAGIVQNSELLIIKANNLDDPETEEIESKQFSDTSVIEGIMYAVDQGAHVINMSLGSSSANPLTEDAIEYARQHNVIVVAASGNDGTSDNFYPASFDGVISVGAVDETSTLWADENSGSNFNDQIDLTAPGVSVITTGLNNTYVNTTGTSLAAPQVTGIIGLMLSYFPTLTDEQIITQLLARTIDQGDPGYDIYYGHGVAHAYRALQINDVTITFETYGGTTMDPLVVLSDQTFEVIDPIKTGHTFLGWFLDESFEFPFQIGVDTTDVNLTLYAKYEQNTYQVSFVTQGTSVSSILVLYGQTFDIPLTELEGHDFEGWYFESNYLTPYTNESVTDDVILYAKFTKSIYTISYYIDDLLDSSIEVEYEDTFVPMTPESEYPFLGWYLDSTFSVIYQSEPVTDHINLYARFDDGLYTVIFYDSNQTSIILQSNVYYGSEIEAPNPPTQDASPSFDYFFDSWSESYDYITEDTFLYPIFVKVYKPESIYLLPGIDTITADETWDDGSIHILDDLLDYEIRGEVDVSIPGRYTIFYDIYEGETIIDSKVRMVRVVEKESKLTITLNPDVTTIMVGDQYEDQGATSNIGEVTSSGTVDVNISGVYIITYEAIYGDQSVTKSKYVYVVENNTLVYNQIPYFKKEQEVWFI